ncbi:uncharacterized protein LOC117514597 isoform X2 [Thalassophryne amazonica]|uniref:uncharacterized protein LOC117514597 isoform X2 n=1 Tax=Thalassophryne amazonica TaxID=390379 RepID=UPI001470E88A|nr:uncharacterized protein LOC117514597 isoform X2 [Thalassophryne amazonica]
MPLNWVFLPSVMSIEYTIDIQLTELAFSEILDSEEAALSTTVKGAGHCASSKPTAESPAPTEQKLKEEEDYKEEEELKDDQNENLQCFQCFITFCSAKAKERHMKKSHREEYKQLQQV